MQFITSMLHNNYILLFDLQLIELPIHIQHKEPRILHCIVDYDKADGNVNNEILLNCWDGTKFFTHSILTYPEQITNKIKEIELQYNISEEPSEKILLRGMMFIGRSMQFLFYFLCYYLDCSIYLTMNL